jgi:uncharacterized protein
MKDFSADPHLPRLAPIEAYGEGGFRFAGMSHRGSILCLPEGIWAWPVDAPAAVSAETLAAVLRTPMRPDIFILGSGRDMWRMPEPLRLLLREAGVKVEVMPTGPAVRTYNILLAENRLIAAGLIAVD